ncbi:MAG: phospholipid carrier-dependent glycosyltransferase, partial [Ardenticatenales bacterium]
PAPNSRRRSVAPLALAVAVFALALGPRLWRIDAHLTPDEMRWVCRTVGFHTGLATGDLPLTLQTGHPGVVTMWLGGLGLPVAPEAAWSKACLESRSSELLYALGSADRHIILDRLYAGRRRIALSTALMAALIVWLAGRLLGRRTALVATPLVALDPFWLAHARFLHLDAVVTGLMSIALLTLLLYLIGPVDDGSRRPAIHGHAPPTRRRWLIGSGIALGLALAAKSPALFVIGYGGVLWLALARRRRTGLRTMVGEGVLWLAVAAATIVAVWPAMWVEPITVLRTVAIDFTRHGTATLERASYFAGVIRDDAGPLFYATVWWLRTSPLVLAGVALAVGRIGRDLVRWRPRRRRGGAAVPTASPGPAGALENAADDGTADGTAVRSAGPRLVVIALLGYMALFTVFLTVANKEFDRYLLPAFPAADIVAAAGLAAAVEWAVRKTRSGGRSARWAAAFAAPAAAAAVLAAQLALVLPIGPYWVTWFDPLVGGAARAQRLMLVGWGEGLDQMAAFLNAQPDAAHLEVASRYRAAFGLLFDGRNVQTEGYDPETTDYVVFMLNQVQRQQDADLLAKYMNVDPPAAAADIGGITLAWAYRNRADEPVRAYLDAHADPATDAVLVRDRHILLRRSAGPLAVVPLPSDDDAAHDVVMDSELANALTAAFTHHDRVWFVHRADDKRTAVERATARLLATSTRFEGAERAGDLIVEAYRRFDGLPPTFAPPPSHRVDLSVGATDTRFHSMKAIGLADGPWPTDRQAAIDLTWLPGATDASSRTLSVQLLDAAGVRRAQLDAKLVDAEGAAREERRRALGGPFVTRFALDVRGLEAGDYVLSIGAYTTDGGHWQTLPVTDETHEGLRDAGLEARIEANRLFVPVRLAASDGAAAPP